MKTVTATPCFHINQQFNIGQHNWDKPENLALGQLSMDKLFRTVALEPNSKMTPLVYDQSNFNIDEMVFDDPLMPNRLLFGEQLLNRRVFNDALLVMHKGNVVHESYRNGMIATDRHVIHSCTKSLCAMLIAIAIDAGLLDPDERLVRYLPEFEQHQAWQVVTLQHVLDMQAGIKYSEDYRDPNADYWSYARATGYYPPKAGETAIGAKAWAVNNLHTQNHQPGTCFVYNSCLANILGMVLERVYQKI